MTESSIVKPCGRVVLDANYFRSLKHAHLEPLRARGFRVSVGFSALHEAWAAAAREASAALERAALVGLNDRRPPTRRRARLRPRAITPLRARLRLSTTWRGNRTVKPMATTKKTVGKWPLSDRSACALRRRIASALSASPSTYR